MIWTTIVVVVLLAARAQALTVANLEIALNDACGVGGCGFAPSLACAGTGNVGLLLSGGGSLGTFRCDSFGDVQQLRINGNTATTDPLTGTLNINLDTMTFLSIQNTKLQGLACTPGSTLRQVTLRSLQSLSTTNVDNCLPVAAASGNHAITLIDLPQLASIGCPDDPKLTTFTLQDLSALTTVTAIPNSAAVTSLTLRRLTSLETDLSAFVNSVLTNNDFVTLNLDDVADDALDSVTTVNLNSATVTCNLVNIDSITSIDVSSGSSVRTLQLNGLGGFSGTIGTIGESVTNLDIIATDVTSLTFSSPATGTNPNFQLSGLTSLSSLSSFPDGVVRFELLDLPALQELPDFSSTIARLTLTRIGSVKREPDDFSPMAPALTQLAMTMPVYSSWPNLETLTTLTHFTVGNNAGATYGTCRLPGDAGSPLTTCSLPNAANGCFMNPGNCDGGGTCGNEAETLDVCGQGANNCPAPVTAASSCSLLTQDNVIAFDVFDENAAITDRDYMCIQLLQDVGVIADTPGSSPCTVVALDTSLFGSSSLGGVDLEAIVNQPATCTFSRASSVDSSDNLATMRIELQSSANVFIEFDGGLTRSCGMQLSAGDNSRRKRATTAAGGLSTTSFATFNLAASATGDPHIKGAHGQKFDFFGKPDAIYTLFSAPQFVVNMQLATYGPKLRFISAAFVRFRNVTLRFDTGAYKPAKMQARLDHQLAHIDGVHVKVGNGRTDIVLCEGHRLSIEQRFAADENDPKFKKMYHLNVQIEVPGCHDDFGGVLGETYRCNGSFKWNKSREEEFHIRHGYQVSPDSKFSPHAPCHDVATEFAGRDPIFGHTGKTALKH